jgi:hypothetical protein
VLVKYLKHVLTLQEKQIVSTAMNLHPEKAMEFTHVHRELLLQGSDGVVQQSS